MQKETNIKTHKTGLQMETYELRVVSPSHDDEGNITMTSLIRALFREAEFLQERSEAYSPALAGMNDLLQPLILEAAKLDVSSHDILYSVFSALHYYNCKSGGSNWAVMADAMEAAEAAVHAACDEVTR